MASFALQSAETTDGGKLLARLRQDSKRKGPKRVGPRSIIEFVNRLTHNTMLVGKTQTSKRHPAHFQRQAHIVRSRSGVWQINLHEAGHALSYLLKDKKPKWYQSLSPGLTALTQMQGSMASAKSAEEGNRIKGTNLDAVSESELLSKALDHTTRDAHRTMTDSFFEMLKEGIAVPGYSESSLWDKLAEFPGQFMSTLMKPIDVANWVTGGRFVSQLGEKLTREGAYIDSVRNGFSEEKAQQNYDEITGNFGQRQGKSFTCPITGLQCFELEMSSSGRHLHDGRRLGCCWACFECARFLDTARLLRLLTSVSRSH